MSKDAIIRWLTPSLPYLQQLPSLTQEHKPRIRLLLAHGAGAPMDHPFMSALAEALVAQNIEVIRFEFPYMAKRRLGGKRGFPNKADVLIECWHTVFEHFSVSDAPVWIGGKSLGARMATVFAGDANVHRQSPWLGGCVCFGYPFHPVGKPQNLRTDHLPALTAPVFIAQGTRDAFGSREEVLGKCMGGNTDVALKSAEPYGYNLGSVKVHWLETCDHDFKPLKRSGMDSSQAIEKAAQAARQFMDDSMAY